ncbi:MAG: alpha-N-arabinofuranosidase, partial [Clostridia bacterium]|nr:alpha-N-arabinofuranosidase [Clostridia bacterium]
MKKTAQFSVRTGPSLGLRSEMLYGHFIEHFHRQIYGGVYDPGSPFSDEDGFRTDVLEAMRQIHVPILRWPGGCFVSSYHWKKAVGPERTPFFDKAWRVEDSNSFGTNEYVRLCRKVGCEPYICTNAGTGTAEEMSDWLEYCNLPSEGEYARLRIAHGFPEPHHVR